MPRSATPTRSKRDRVKALPWDALLQASVVIGRRWWALSEKDRARLSSLLRDSGGRLGNLSSRERNELRKLVGKLDFKAMSRELLLLTGARRGRGKRSRRRVS